MIEYMVLLVENGRNETTRREIIKYVDIEDDRLFRYEGKSLIVAMGKAPDGRMMPPLQHEFTFEIVAKTDEDAFKKFTPTLEKAAPDEKKKFLEKIQPPQQKGKILVPQPAAPRVGPHLIGG